MNSISDFLEFKVLDLESFSLSILNLLIILVILVLSKLIVWFISKYYYQKLARNKRISEGKVFAISKLTQYFIYIFAFVFILHSLGLNLTFFIASSAALLIGVGIGLQHTFNDLVSGLILLFEGSIQVGDVVEVNNELLGIVREIGVRTSVIETRDQIHIIVPNSRIIGNDVVNWSHGRRMTRLRVEVDVAYGTDEEKVKKVLMECAAQEPEIEQNPRPSVRMAEFGDSGIRFELLYYTKNIINIGRVKSNLRFYIYKAFREHEIVIPFPQRDVHHISSKQE